MAKSQGKLLPWPGEAALVAAVKAGDPDAFRHLLEQHQRAVLAVCLRFNNDPAAAQDIAQEVFLTLWRNRETYEDRGRLRAYLLEVTRLRCLAAGKKNRSRLRLVEKLKGEPARQDEPIPRLDAAHDAARFQSQLHGLDPDQAEMIRLRHLEELSLQEIHDLTGQKLGTIKSRLNRGLAALRKEVL